MFRTSSQKKNLFKNVEEIRIAREKVNKEFLVNNPQCASYALTPEEERLLCRKFEREMLRFCSVRINVNFKQFIDLLLQFTLDITRHPCFKLTFNRFLSHRCLEV